MLINVVLIVVGIESDLVVINGSIMLMLGIIFVVGVVGIVVFVKNGIGNGVLMVIFSDFKLVVFGKMIKLVMGYIIMLIWNLNDILGN